MKRKLIAGGVLAIFFKCAGLGLSLLLSVVVARFFGIESTGLVAYGVAMGTLVAKFSMMGVGASTTKWVAHHKQLGMHNKVVGGVNSAFKFGFTSSSVSAAVIIFLFYKGFLGSEKYDWNMLSVVFYGSVLVTISSISIGALKGMGRGWQSVLVDSIPLQFVTLVVVGGLHISGYEISFFCYVAIWFFSVLISGVVRRLYWVKCRPIISEKESVPISEVLKFSSGFYLSSLTVIALGQIDNLMLGWLGSKEDLGGYAVAYRLAQIMIVFQALTDSFTAPRIAKSLAINDLDKAVLVVSKTASYLIMLCLPILLFYFAFAHNVLSIWGEEFAEYRAVLLILVFSQFINVSVGPCGKLLLFSDFGRIRNSIAVITVFVDVVLNYFFISSYGAIGAAIATGFSYSMMNLMFWLAVRIKLGRFVMPRFGYILEILGR